MPRLSTRKLFLFGRYSLALLLPKKWLRELGVGPGEKVRLEFDKTRRRIVIRLSGGEESAQKPAKPKKRPDDDDWQPIPSM